jgi:uncharacterized membrane protein
MVYLSTTATLIATVAAFFLWARRGLSAFGWLQWVLRILAALPLLASGVLHFTRTALMASMIPPFFPDHLQLVVLTGVFELAGAIGLLLPPFTRVASACLAVLMIVIFPANVFVAGETLGGLHMPSAPVRLAMQVVYILLLLLGGWGIPGRPDREPQIPPPGSLSTKGTAPAVP